VRRRRAHALFATVAAGCALAATMHGVRLQRATAIEAQVAATAAAPSDAAAGAAASAGPGPSHAEADEVRLARAVALAAAERYEPALDAYKALVRSERAVLRRAALFNLGNLHLREAQRRAAFDSVQAAALVELAKQSYRDLLREDPGDWDARYNLERALWKAPEHDDADDEGVAPERSERAITTMQSDRGALP
jgi:mxaK protein